jgi:hypothetical protein
MKIKQSIRRILHFMCILFSATFSTNAAAKKVLFYGPTHEPGGVAETLVNTSPGEFAPIGSGSAIWFPGAPSAANDWSRKTTSDFQAFDAIVIGDLNEPFGDVFLWAGAIANRDLWSGPSVITGNVIIFGGDAEQHGSEDDPGAKALIEQSLRFAAANGRGLFVSLSDINVTGPSPVHPLVPVGEDLLGALGSFTMTWLGEHSVINSVRKLYSHPSIDCVSEKQLSDWAASCHSGFLNYPFGYFPLALATDVPAQFRTPAALLPGGEIGLVHLLAKGSFKQFYLTPQLTGRVNNQSYIATAKYISEIGAGISGATVYFEVTEGPNAGQSATRTTDATGTATWSYTGSSVVGRDTILATLTSSGQTCHPTARAFVDWNVNVVTISSAADSIAVEPATSGGTVNTGTFTVTRSGSTASPLTVNLTFSGTATMATDYTVPNTYVTINANNASATLLVSPTFDGLSEATEKVVARITDNPSIYAMGIPAEATVNITSSTTDSITLLAVDDVLDETGDNSGTLKLHRGGTSGNTLVSLEFSGTASFADDYIIEGLNPDNTATILAGQQDLFITIHPIPDTRSEGTGEPLTITIKAAADGSYTRGSPFAKTVTILDDDAIQIPSLGWKLTDLGSFGGFSSGEALAINNIPLGGGQFRGQVVGNQDNGSGGYKGALWDNGTYTFRNYPSSWNNFFTYLVYSRAVGVNDAGTAVGYCSYDDLYGTDTFPSYWPAGSTTPVLLPLLSTESTTGNRGTAINQRDALNNTGGIIVGYQRTSGGNVHAVMWIPAANETYPSTGLHDLFDIGSGDRNSLANAINHFGEVVGKSQIPGSSVYHAFRSDYETDLTPKALIPANDMGTSTFADGNPSEANDINNYGELVGASQFMNNYHAAYKAPNTPKNLGWYRLRVLGEGTANAGTQSIARGINNAGLVVGRSQIKVNNAMVWHAFVVSNQGNPGSQPMIDLNDMKDPVNNIPWVAVDIGGNTFVSAASQGWVIINVEKVNDGNWIVGYGYKAGLYHAFVLSPR